MRGFAKLLKHNHLEERDRQEYLDIIISESERLADLATNVLNFTKYDHTEIIINKTLYQLDEQIRRVIVMTEPKWAEKELHVNVIMDNIIFHGNEDLIQQIWLNLLDNAIKSSNQGGTITICLSNWNNHIRFTLQDNGEGMSEQTLSHMFDKFYQGDTSHSKAGNGLGLAIVKRIVDLHGGRVEVESEKGKGTTFTVVLAQPRGKTMSSPLYKTCYYIFFMSSASIPGSFVMILSTF